MKKITIGVVAVISLLSFTAFAATNGASKDTSIPCYNGGYTFGLAGYDTKNFSSSSEVSPESAQYPSEDDLKDNKNNIKTEYK